MHMCGIEGSRCVCGVGFCSEKSKSFVLCLGLLRCKQLAASGEFYFLV